MGRSKDQKVLCYCAFCRTPHRIYVKKGIGAKEILSALLLSLSFMWGIWGAWSLRAIPIFLATLFVGEWIAHFRWRLALVCRQCGFDPLIYKQSPARAAQKVKDFLDRRRLNPSYLMAPALNLPKRTRPASSSLSKRY